VAPLRALALRLAGDAQRFRDQARPVADAADAEFWAAKEPTCEGQAPDAPAL
jgi:hypothetical protein